MVVIKIPAVNINIIGYIYKFEKIWAIFTIFPIFLGYICNFENNWTIFTNLKTFWAIFAIFNSSWHDSLGLPERSSGFFWVVRGPKWPNICPLRPSLILC